MANPDKMNHTLPPGTYPHHIEDRFGDDRERPEDRRERIEAERADMWQDQKVDREADELERQHND